MIPEFIVYHGISYICLSFELNHNTTHVHYNFSNELEVSSLYYYTVFQQKGFLTNRIL